MSSNIKVQRICQHCGQEFTARTTVTQYCGDSCAKKAYKARQRSAKISTSNDETKRFVSGPIEIIKTKEFLTVRDVATLLNCSLRTAYRLIETGNINAVNLAQRKTLVRRSDIDKLFEPSRPVSTAPDTESIPETVNYETANCYTISEAITRCGISESAFRSLLNRHNIPKFQKGRSVYVPKTIIESLLINLQSTQGK
ncbi:MAG: excisionase family DNA binding domain-containing protein [Bacteroidetes bacterium]|nr:MAG: excisionase family DNA binding domain-containing protein [Bacteroidota bacterium]